MAAVPPTTFFANYTSDGTNIMIPIASLAGLSSAEAHPVTGDGREVLRILIETAYQNFAALTTKPTRMAFSKPSPQGIGENQLRQSYTASFDIQIDPTLVSLVED